MLCFPRIIGGVDGVKGDTDAAHPRLCHTLIVS